MNARFINDKVFALIMIALTIVSGFGGSVRATGATLEDGGGPSLVAPANDNFANAQVLAGTSGQFTASNDGATKEANEPAHALNRGGSSIWYKYVAPSSGAMTISATGSVDTLVAAYTGTNINNLKLVAGNDDFYSGSSGGIASLCTFGVQNGTTYYFAVDGVKRDGVPAATGSFTFEYDYDAVPKNNSFAAAQAFSNYSWTKTFTGTNVAATKQPGEPNHGGNAGGKSIWFKWTNQSDLKRTFAFTVEGRSLADPSVPVNTAFAVYSGSSVDSLATLGSTQGLGASRLLIVDAEPFTTYHLAVDGVNTGAGAAVGTFTITSTVQRPEKVTDFDRDGRTDLTVFRPSNGTWYSLDTVTGNLRSVVFGANGDTPMVSDFDRDGHSDYAVYRPSTGYWYMLNSTAGFEAVNWGLSTDLPLPHSSYFLSTAYSTPVVFRPSNGTWYLNGLNAVPLAFGQAGDIPVSADFNGDGTDEYAVFRPANGTWYILDSIANQYQAVQFGMNGDRPVAADYDADGRADIAVFRPSNGTWYIIKSGDNTLKVSQFGQNGDIPQPADYRNDGKADLAVYRAGTWYILDSNTGDMTVTAFGLPTDIPVSSPVR